MADSYRTQPDPDLISIKGVLDSLPDEKMRPDTLIDATPWERVANSSLVEELYGKK